MGNRVLLVEGNDDLHVMANLFAVRGVADAFQVKSVATEEQVFQGDWGGGIEMLLKSIRVWLDRSELECLAIVLDADDKGPDNRWQSIRQRLIHSGCDSAAVPTPHHEHGVVLDLALGSLTPRSIRFSAWIMPDNRSFGMIEDFVLHLIPRGDEMLPRVQSFLDSIPESERRFSPAHLSKARIHSWLAVSERPGRPMGQAIKCDPHNIDVSGPAVHAFLDWVQRALID